MKSFIPKRVNNRVVVGFLGFARAVGKPFNKRNKASDESQLVRIQKHFEVFHATKGYIEDQNSYTDVAYGGKSLQYAGCGVLATYNALWALERMNKKHPDNAYDAERLNNSESIYSSRLLELLKEYERTGIVFSGNLGTAPMPIKKYFDRRGYKTVISYKSAEFDRIGEEYDTFVLTAYMDGSDITKSVHHIQISKENGMFTPHNVYCNGYLSKPQKSISEVIESINNGKAKGICLIGIM